MLLSDFIDISDMAHEAHEGYVKVQVHPEFPHLQIAGYTDKCQYDNHWTPTTKALRGVIFDVRTFEVKARPFGKFFNYGQQPEQYDPDAAIIGAYNKWDGSLGIGYVQPNGRPAIATRGSFVSEQAIHANDLLAKDPDLQDAIRSWVSDDITPLWEIVYPQNRIVVDYGDMDDLVFLGTVDNATGEFSPWADSRFQEPAHGGTLREILEIPPRKNHEGFVIWFDPAHAVKVKQEDYLALHRIVSSLSVKEVWRQLRAGTFRSWAEGLPDEFHEWARETALPMALDYDDKLTGMRKIHEGLLAKGFPTRKEQALWVQEFIAPEDRGLMFGLLDGRDISDSIWRQLEPKGNQPMRNVESE
ncbi:RNA ligase [Gryllotalpicola koreensis]|uniref:T4 RNA ligase 1-like N-terminal domain-containing protein n=1 Tax=Gryllotalpicola koreensis TaxID=993086 RepID=A0ABP8A257_9MICO